MRFIDSRERRFPPTLILESFHLHVSVQFSHPDDMPFYAHKTIPKHTKKAPRSYNPVVECWLQTKCRGFGPLQEYFSFIK